MKTYVSLVMLFILSISLKAQDKKIESKVDSVLNMMTLDEKIGQLNQYTGDRDATGPITNNPDKLKDIRDGKLGSMLNVRGAKETRAVQEIAMQSRMKIPLIFGLDVIHGYRVTFPIPLAEAASWDLSAIENAARVAARETAASGVHWTFAPMVDIARDPRWGRVMEGAGEDTYLGSKIAFARVKGFQGKGLGSLDAVMACAKHFAAYGAAIAGRDYNAVDISEHTLWETYLPPFKAAVDAGAATFMNSFNTLNGIPATASSYLQRDILKGLWKYPGFVVSDWGSIGEMVDHGFAENKIKAAEMAIKAGSDMDMESRSYLPNLARLVKDKKVPVTLIDDAVRRILRKKFELGLFDDPYRFSNLTRQDKELNAAGNRQAALSMAEKSMVLLKNEGKLLPLSRELKKIAVIGPLAKSEKDMQGFWSISWENDQLISLYQGMKNKLGDKTELLYARGCDISDTSRNDFAQAVAVARQADVIVMAVGETLDMSGEAKSKAHIRIPGIQEDLVEAIQATGKPVVVLVMAGRPLIFNWTADHVPAILYTWWLGSEAGNAMANVLFGDYNPGGKLPMTFPRDEGQIPIYYNYLSTGRPAKNDQDTRYRSAYLDMPNSPKFAFGHGLSYTTFEYSGLIFDKTELRRNEKMEVSFTLKNTGNFAGEEVVQLYLQDKFASVVRPVKELKDFKKIMLKPGETKTVSFIIDQEKLSFYNQKLQWAAEPGEFKVMIGTASNNIRLQKDFLLKD
ncbi:MAG: beta-glucosidase BglX [Chryseobacterium sp.]|nr:MAG: beta-glucosidase BglX [Chryseobacterium sp.]